MPEIIDSLKDIFAYTMAGSSIENILGRISAEGGVLTVNGERFDLSASRKIFFAGTGAGSHEMAGHLERILGDRLNQGLILVPPGNYSRLKVTKIKETGSPLIDPASRQSLSDLLFFLNGAKSEDLVILFLSKGTPYMLEKLPASMDIQDYHILLKNLRESDMKKADMDTIIMHVSQLKGGKLLNHTRPARVICLAISDEPGAEPGKVFQSPTWYDPADFDYCREVLIRNRIALKLPPSVLSYFSEGMSGKIPDTVKENDDKLENVRNMILYDSHSLALHAMESARKAGFPPMLLSSMLEEDPGPLGRFMGQLIRNIRRYDGPVSPPCALIATGCIRGEENSRIDKLCSAALSFAREIAGVENAGFLAGTVFQFEKEGPVACVVDGGTFEKMEKITLKNLSTQSCEPFKILEKAGSIIESGNNPIDCGDVFIALCGSA